MNPAVRLCASATRAAGPLLAGLLACLALAGCEPTDPLEAIRQQQATGDAEGSLEPLRELLAERPDDAEANYLYGRALVLTQRSSLATFALRKAMEDPEWLVLAGSQLALAALATRDFNEVVEVTGRILAGHPDQVDALLLRAQAQAHWRKDPEAALVDARRVLELAPSRTEAYEPMILALLALERPEEAREALAEAGRVLGELEVSEAKVGWLCATNAIFTEEGGDVDGAREQWSECLAAHPAHENVVANAMKFHDARGELDDSLEIIRGAVAAAPTSRNFRKTLADRLVISGDAAEAESVLREGTRAEDPVIAGSAWMDLGKLRQTLGEFGASAEAMERAVDRAREAGTPNPQLLFEYADALVLANRLDRALQVAEEDISLPAHRHLVRARVAQQRRDPGRALAEFDEAFRLWPNNPWARYNAALAAEEFGDFDRALEEYRYSIRISAGATDARTRAARLLLAERKAVLAAQLLHMKSGAEPLDLEGELLSLQLSALIGEREQVEAALARVAQGHPAIVGRAAATAAEGIAQRAGAAAAVGLLETVPGIDGGDPSRDEGLRALVRFGHAAGEPASARAALQSALAAAPDSGSLHAIRGLDLELGGAAAESVRAAYARSLELDSGSAPALAGLGRLTLEQDPEQALDFFDRAAAADAADAEAKLGAVRALVAAGRTEEAARRLDVLLREHPFEAEAATLRVRLDLDRGEATPRTLERARRAVRFGGGADALELLSQVQAQRGESESAAPANPRGDNASARSPS